MDGGRGGCLFDGGYPAYDDAGKKRFRFFPFLLAGPAHSRWEAGCSSGHWPRLAREQIQSALISPAADSRCPPPGFVVPGKSGVRPGRFCPFSADSRKSGAEIPRFSPLGHPPHRIGLQARNFRRRPGGGFPQKAAAS